MPEAADVLVLLTVGPIPGSQETNRLIFSTGLPRPRKEKVRDHVPKGLRIAPSLHSPAFIAAGVATLALVAGILILSGQERHVVIDRITVVNPTAYRLEVEASAPRNGRTLRLGAVESQSQASFRNVSDQGKLWLFGFLYAGEEVGVVAVGEDRLKERDWRVVVPMDVDVHLRAVGAAPSAGPGVR